MQPESDHPHHRPLLALVLRLAAAFVLAGLLACVKLASERGIHLAEIMFWRQLPTIPILFGWFALRGRLDVLKPGAPALTCVARASVSSAWR